ncbi:MAG: DUF1697 domain-containing protein [Ignavibacteriaceae bacterium]|nr:DUF1697 domain-containing protein [Ignavibacteriaceae bacterium]
MKKFIALLRGINVSGQRLIKMSDLKILFEKVGFNGVETYLQSGNVIFTSKETSTEKLSLKISSAIKKQFGFDVQLIVVTLEEIEQVIKKNPFIKKKKEAEKLYVVFLSEKPLIENMDKLNSIDYAPEEYIIDEKYIYLFVPNGYGKAKLNNNLFENKLKVFGTTRNLNTIKALFELTELH